jgi:hypothetical protein
LYALFITNVTNAILTTIKLYRYKNNKKKENTKKRTNQ